MLYLSGLCRPHESDQIHLSYIGDACVTHDSTVLNDICLPGYYCPEGSPVLHFAVLVEQIWVPLASKISELSANLVWAGMIIMSWNCACDLLWLLVTSDESIFVGFDPILYFHQVNEDLLLLIVVIVVIVVLCEHLGPQEPFISINVYSTWSNSVQGRDIRQTTKIRESIDLVDVEESVIPEFYRCMCIK